MVSEHVRQALLNCQALVAAIDEKAQPLLYRLAPTERARVIMALLGIVLIGLALLALVMVGGRRLRRIARSRPGPARTNDDDWFRKPLISGNGDETPPSAPPSDTR